jgi:hypothetical protein
MPRQFPSSFLPAPPQIRAKTSSATIPTPARTQMAGVSEASAATAPPTLAQTAVEKASQQAALAVMTGNVRPQVESLSPPQKQSPPLQLIRLLDSCSAATITATVLLLSVRSHPSLLRLFELPFSTADPCADVVCASAGPCQEPDGQCIGGVCSYRQADPGTDCSDRGFPAGSTCDADGQCQPPGKVSPSACFTSGRVPLCKGSRGKALKIRDIDIKHILWLHSSIFISARFVAAPQGRCVGHVIDATLLCTPENVYCFSNATGSQLQASPAEPSPVAGQIG